MTTTFTRKAIIKWGGQSLSPEIAYGVRDAPGVDIRMVTWAEVMDARRERQAKRLCNKRRRGPERRAWKLWVAYFDQFIMGGWHTFLENRDELIWINRDGRHYIDGIMETFGVLEPRLFETGRDRWQQWQKAFAKQYKRRTQDRRPVGVAYVWWDGHDGKIELAKERIELRRKG